LVEEDCRRRCWEREIGVGDVAAGFVGVRAQRNSGFSARFPPVMGLIGSRWTSFGSAESTYPSESPSFIAMCRMVARNGNGLPDVLYQRDC
jgi:hypothetical protein